MEILRPTNNRPQFLSFFFQKNTLISLFFSLLKSRWVFPFLYIEHSISSDHYQLIDNMKMVPLLSELSAVLSTIS